MKEIDLPVLPPETPLRATMAVLHAMRRSAVVTFRFGDVILVRARSIIRAANHGAQFLGDAVGELISTSLALPQKTLGTGWAQTESVIEAPREFALGPDDWRFQNFFAGTTSINFALSSLAPGRAMIVTRTEGHAGGIESAPSDCYCTNIEDHPVNGGPPPSCTMCTHDVECI